MPVGLIRLLWARWFFVSAVAASVSVPWCVPYSSAYPCDVLPLVGLCRPVFRLFCFPEAEGVCFVHTEDVTIRYRWVGYEMDAVHPARPYVSALELHGCREGEANATVDRRIIIVQWNRPLSSNLVWSPKSLVLLLFLSIPLSAHHLYTTIMCFLSISRPKNT